MFCYTGAALCTGKGAAAGWPTRCRAILCSLPCAEERYQTARGNGRAAQCGRRVLLPSARTGGFPGAGGCRVLVKTTHGRHHEAEGARLRSVADLPPLLQGRCSTDRSLQERFYNCKPAGPAGSSAAKLKDFGLQDATELPHRHRPGGRGDQCTAFGAASRVLSTNWSLRLLGVSS